MAEVVFITGGTGYVGFKTILTALRNGYHVRAAVRTQEKLEAIKAHPKLAPFILQFDLFIVPEMGLPGAFDGILDGVTAILHIASGTDFETTDYQHDLIDPAVNMSISILHSAIKTPMIRKVVICSSLVTVASWEWALHPAAATIFRAEDINSRPTLPVTSAVQGYWESKALARLAVRDFVATHDPHFQVIQLLPSVIMGVDERAQSVADLEKIPFFAIRFGPLFGVTTKVAMHTAVVDIADVARAHVDAIKLAKPSRIHEFILSADGPDGFHWDSLIDIVKKKWPERIGKNLPANGHLPDSLWRCDASATEEAFGWKFRGLEEVFTDLVGQYLHLYDLPNED